MVAGSLSSARTDLAVAGGAVCEPAIAPAGELALKMKNPGALFRMPHRIMGRAAGPPGIGIGSGNG